MPIQAFAGFFGSINAYFGGLLSIAISLYAIYLFYNALIHALNANENPAKIVTGVPALLAIVGLLGSAAATARANKAAKDAEKTLDQLQEQIQKQFQD